MSTQVFITLLCVRADFKNAVDWEVQNLRLIPNSFSSFSKNMGTLQRVPITNGITVIFIMLQIFQPSVKFLILVEVLFH